jgi:hypothetical protein
VTSGCGDAHDPYSVYDDTPISKRDGPLKLLQDFTGHLQADAFAGYDGIYMRPVGCANRR